MAAVPGAYGLRVVNNLGGRAMTSAFNQFKIASAYNTNIFSGDIVKFAADGSVAKDAGTSTATPVGIFVGCFYTDTQAGPQFANYWPANQVASDAVAYVVDDPRCLFKVAVESASGTVSSLARTDLNRNLSIIQGTGSTTTGRSAVSVDDTSNTTNTLPIRVIGLVEETVNSSGGYTEVICKWNVGHVYENTTGV